MRTVDLILLLVAAVCFAAAALTAGRPAYPRVWPTCVALGLLAWVLVPLIAAIRAT